MTRPGNKPADPTVVNEDGVGEVAIPFGLPLDPTKARLPMRFAPIPPELLPYLGQIALNWGGFETSFDRVLEAMIDHNKSASLEGRRTFNERRKRFMKEARMAFAQHPVLHGYVLEILNDCASIQLDRNLLLHASIEVRVRITASPGDGIRHSVAIVATGQKANKPVVRTFDLEALEELYYAVAHLAGRMAELTEQEPAIPGLSSPDRSWLRTLLASYRDGSRPHT